MGEAMSKGWKKSQRKYPQWLPAVIDYMREQDEPVSVKRIIAETKTYRHHTMKNGKAERTTLLCKSRACPEPRTVAYEFRIRKIPYIQDKKCRLYYLEDDYEIPN